MRIAVIGALTRDFIRAPGSSETVTQAGGGVYYASRALAVFGVNVRAFPIVGREDLNHLEALRFDGIEITPLLSDATSEFEISYESSSDARMVRCRGEGRASRLTAEHQDLIAECDAVLALPLSPRELPVGFLDVLCRLMKGPLAVDAQGFARGASLEPVASVLRVSDILKVDEEELRILSGEINESEGLSKVLKMGTREIVLTRGSRGATIATKNGEIDIPPAPVDRVVDPTGCGDTFLAAYLYRRVSGDDISSAGRFAAGAASQKIKFRGALR